MMVRRPPRLRSSRLRSVPLLTLILATILPACGGGGGNRAASVLPKDTIGLFTLSLDPAVAQKRALRSVLSQFPFEIAKKEFEDQVDQFLTQLLKVAALSYKREVKPWLGPEISLALLPGADGPVPLLVVSAKDEGLARRSMEGARKSGFEGAYRIREGLVLVTPAGPGEAALSALDAKPPEGARSLAGHLPFDRLISKMRQDFLVLGWVDGQRALSAVSEAVPDFGGVAVEQLFGQGSKGGAFAFTLHAADRSVVVESFALSEAKGDKDAPRAPRLTESLPIETAATLTLFDIGGQVEGALRNLPGGGEIDKALDTLSESSGLDVRRDLFSWMRGELVLAAGKLDASAGFPDLAIVAEVTDQAAAEAGLARLRDSITKGAKPDAGAGVLGFLSRDLGGTTVYELDQPLSDGLQPAMGLFGDRFVLASDFDHLKTLATVRGKALGSAEGYRRAFEGLPGDAVELQLFVQAKPIRTFVEGLLDPGARKDYDDRAAPFLRPIESLSARSAREGGGSRLVLRLSVEAPPKAPAKK